MVTKYTTYKLSMAQALDSTQTDKQRHKHIETHEEGTGNMTSAARHGYEALGSEAEAKQKLQLNHEAEAETEAQALLEDRSQSRSRSFEF